MTVDDDLERGSDLLQRQQLKDSANHHRLGLPETVSVRLGPAAFTYELVYGLARSARYRDNCGSDVALDGQQYSR